ncbi:lycopene cyclase family protein [Streptomyces sp. NPDC050504]|uniref:lycopene cyclase family protein n=1 Tax=Streptomyces sp. NPDC050504 TaxID=3365618 RepID=UPI003798A0D2
MSRPDPGAGELLDAVIVGGGASGLGLAHHLLRSPPLSFAVIEPPDGPARPPERTWCYWTGRSDPFEDAVSASWTRLRVHGADGGPVTVDPSPLRYRMLRSTRFERLVHDRMADAPGARLVRATAGAVRTAPDAVEVRCMAPDGRTLTLRARHLFDSRPPRTVPPARTLLWQHFRGWFVRTATDRFDPEVADLMDFRVPQPRHGLAFGYVLPLAPDRALVEYTEFSRAPLTHDAYETALRHYTRDVLRLGALSVDRTEQGVIPMTDARFPHRTGRATFRIGTAGGATRPSTGYTFAAAARHGAAIAAALHGNRRVPAPHGRRALAMDAVMLRALDTGRVDGPDFFTRLFRTVPPARLLRFLDGATSPREDAAVGLHVPVVPMLRTAVELPFLPRRSPTGPVHRPADAAHRPGAPRP